MRITHFIPVFAILFSVSSISQGLISRPQAVVEQLRWMPSWGDLGVGDLGEPAVLLKPRNVFDWQSYERLEKLWESGAPLSQKDLALWARLHREYERLKDWPGFEESRPVARDQDAKRQQTYCFAVPGLWTFGCGASTAASAEKPKEPSKTERPKSEEEQFEALFLGNTIWFPDGTDAERQKPDDILLAVNQAKQSGVLNLAQIQMTTSQLEFLLSCIPASMALKITEIDLRECGLEGELPSLTRFGTLKILKIDDNQITGLSRLPTSLAELSARANRLNALPDSLARGALTRVYLEGNPMNRFPGELLAHLDTQVGAVLDLSRTGIRALPGGFQPRGYTQITLSNWPGLAPVPGRVILRGDFPSQITDALFLGAVQHLDAGVLRPIGVGAVVNAANDRQVTGAANALTGISVTHLSLSDEPTQAVNFRELANTVQSQIETHGVVMVNCFKGVSRSATVVIAYLMLHQNKTLIEAIRLVKAARPIIQPNPGFLKQLAELERELRPTGPTVEQILEEIKNEFRFPVPAPQAAAASADDLFGGFVE